jgi:hypothetical protein
MPPKVTTDPGRLRQFARSVEGYADDASALHTAVDQLPPQPESIFGPFGVVAAYTTFQQLWSIQVGMISSGCRRLADGLGVSAASYEYADQAAARQLGAD